MTPPPATTVRQFHFQDRRPPHEVQFALERELMTLLQPSIQDARLTFRGAAIVNTVPFRVALHLEAALPRINCYVLEFAAAESNLSAVPPAGRGKYLDAWVSLWCRDLKSTPAPKPGDGSAERAQALAEQALAAEAHLTDVHAIQVDILAAMRQGATFSTAHKEGGTNINYKDGRFARSDYGESDDWELFHDEATFLAFLRRFFNFEVTRNAHQGQLSEYDAWKLILRLMRKKP